LVHDRLQAQGLVGRRRFIVERELGRLKLGGFELER
jgi:hypothetical protein